MLKSLQQIQAFENGDMQVLNEAAWLKYLVMTEEKNANLENVHSLNDLTTKTVFRYVKRTLSLLNDLPISDFHKRLIEETLKWSEVAKCGSNEERKEWLDKGYNLYAHNIGSAEIFLEHHEDVFYRSKNVDMVHLLIQTHGLVGQYLKGEVPFAANLPLKKLLGEDFRVSPADFQQLILSLNHCIIAGVSMDLWKSVVPNVQETISDLLEKVEVKESFIDRILKMRDKPMKNGENTQELLDYYVAEYPFLQDTFRLLDNKTFWYVDSAMGEFSLEEFLKILHLLSNNKDTLSVEHIHFDKVMKELYYNYKGEKTVNIYKKRIIEHYLRHLSFENENSSIHSEHLVHEVEVFGDSVHFSFNFSAPSAKLIEFCEVAEQTESPLFERAVLMLFDLFGLRRDAFDRLHNEKTYLETMNQNSDDKKKMIQFIAGENVLDIGPGGGVLMDLIEQQYPEKTIHGIDISENVIQELERRKQREQRDWKLHKGDALNLKSHFHEGEIDTVIFSSVLHELYSYIPFNGKKFNIDTVKQSLISAFSILPSKGRIIIRDGIKSEPESEMRIIRFKNKADMAIFHQYVEDFKGRKIQFEQLSEDTVKLPINDSMEFLYTFTWGQNSYPHEVQEQFGYLTPTEFNQMVNELFNDNARILYDDAYLQTGYVENLSKQIDFFNEDYQPVNLPNSTFLFVIEKK